MAFIVSSRPGSSINVNGPGPGEGVSTENAVARWGNTTGTLLKNSGVILDDSDAITGVSSLTVTNLIATTTITTGDNLIVLNDDVAGAPSEDAGIEINRGASTDARLLWDETNDYWKAGVSGSEARILLAGGLINGGVVTLTDAATVALNAAQGHTFRLSATADRTIGIPTNPTDGQVIDIEHTAVSADRTLTLTTGSSGSFAFGTELTALTATTGTTRDIIRCKYNQPLQRWLVLAVKKGF